MTQSLRGSALGVRAYYPPVAVPLFPGSIGQPQAQDPCVRSRTRRTNVLIGGRGRDVVSTRSVINHP
eukprot:3282292-Amphidinium_carterae.1